MIDRDVEILLIEDNPADAQLTVDALRLVNPTCSITICEDGESALARLGDVGRRMPDLILLDLNLPGIDGREVLHDLKQSSRLRSIPVCVLTTSRAEDDIAQAYANYTNCYIVKPVDLNSFRRMIQQVQAFWFGVVNLPSPVVHG